MAKDPLTGEPVPWNDLHKQYIDGSVENDLPMTRLSEMFNVNHFIVSQVNPHVLPFLSKDESPRSETEQGTPSNPGWLRTMTHLAKDEMLHRMTVFSEMGIFPTFLTKAVSVVNQKYFGDITIFPEIPYTSFPLMLKNPTTDFMLKACLGGERATWPKLGRIRNHLAIELALDSAIQTMRARVAFCPTQTNLMVNGGFVYHHTLTSFDISGGRGRPPRRRRSSYSQDLGEIKEAASCHTGSCPAHKIRMARKYSSFEQPHATNPISGLDLDGHATEYYETGSRNNSIQSMYAENGPFVVDSDTSDSASVSSPERPRILVHRASWGPSSYDYMSNSWPDRQSPVRFRSRRSSVSSSSCSRRSSSVGTVGQHSNPPGGGFPLTAKAMSPSSCRMLNMTRTGGAEFGGSSAWGVYY